MAEVAPDFLQASERLKSYRQRKPAYANHIMPTIGDRIVGRSGGRHRRALDAVEERGLNQTTNRVRETLLALFEFTVDGSSPTPILSPGPSAARSNQARAHAGLGRVTDNLAWPR